MMAIELGLLILNRSFGYIYLCGAFWQAPTTGTDSKGGTLVHEVCSRRHPPLD